MSKIQNSSILEIPHCFFRISVVARVVAMVVVINSVSDVFSSVDLVSLAASTVRLQVSDYNQLSYYN